MRVTIHGPGLADSSEGSFRVHEETSSENAREIKCNGSLHPDTVEVLSREAVVEIIFPEDEFDREPEALPMFLADIYFGESCSDLPLYAENPNEGGEVSYTDEQKTDALKAYTEKPSFRAVGKALSISATTAKKIVEAAQADAEAAKAAEAPARATRASGPSVPAKVDASVMVPCRHCKDAKGHAIEHPATTEFWYVNKGTGELHTQSRCKIAEKKYRDDKKAAKAKTEAAAEKAAAKAAKETAESSRHLTAVA